MILDFKDTLLKLIDSFIRDNVYTALPGVVLDVSEYQGKMSVDVNVTISRLYSTGDVLPNTNCVIYKVPVIMPGAGNGLLSFPIKKGDSVLLLFCMRNMDSWRASDGSTDVIPDDSRHYSETDAIALPGFCTESNHLSPHPENVELKFGNCLISMTPDDTITVNNGSGSIQMSSDGTINLNGVIINTDGSLESPTSITSPSIVADGDELAAHFHGGVQSGMANTNPLGA